MTLGMSDLTVELFELAAQKSFFQHGGGSCLSLGTLDFWVTEEVLHRFGITTISAQELKEHFSLDVRSQYDLWMASSKQLCAKVVAHYGYDTYEDLDINKYSDYRVDLCEPVDESLHEKYDLVLDSVVPYISNPLQGYENICRMLRLGGNLITFSFLHQINRAYLTPQPNFLEDYFDANGLETIRHIVFSSSAGRICDYDRTKVKRKIWRLHDVIPADDAFDYYFDKLCEANHASGRRRWLSVGLKILRKFTVKSRHDFLSIAVFARKIRSVDKMTQPIKDVYRL